VGWRNGAACPRGAGRCPDSRFQIPQATSLNRAAPSSVLWWRDGCGEKALLSAVPDGQVRVLVRQKGVVAKLSANCSHCNLSTPMRNKT